MTVPQAFWTSLTSTVVAGLTLTAAFMSVLAGTDSAYAQAKEKSLYERLGGIFAIAAVVNHFSDAVVKNPIVGQRSKNPQLQHWHTKNLKRLPGLKFMRTLWVGEASGGPYKFSATRPGKTALGLEEAHRDLKISPEERARHADYFSGSPALRRPSKRCSASSERLKGDSRACVRSIVYWGSIRRTSTASV